MSQRLIGVGFVAIGLGILYLDTEVSLRCVAAPPSGLNCEAQRRILGFVPLERMAVHGVTAARVERQIIVGSGSGHTEASERLVLRSGTTDVPLPWFSRRTGAPPGTVYIELEPFDRIADDITQLAVHGAAGEVAAYGDISWIPLLVGVGFLLFGILAVWPW